MNRCTVSFIPPGRLVNSNARSSVKSAVGLLKEYYPYMRSEWPLAGLQLVIEQIQALRACLFGDCLQPTQFRWKSPSYGGLDQPKSSTLSDYRRATGGSHSEISSSLNLVSVRTFCWSLYRVHVLVIHFIC